MHESYPPRQPAKAGALRAPRPASCPACRAPSRCRSRWRRRRGRPPCCRGMPPTGSSSASAGSTARKAFTPAGVSISAGNSFSAVAPAASAAKASVGVSTPGRQTMPSALPRARPRHRSSARRSAARRPRAPRAPARPSAPCRRRPARRGKSRPARRCWPAARGELSGTSISCQPARTSAVPMATASPGRTPRRIATSGQACACACANCVECAHASILSSSRDAPQAVPGRLRADAAHAHPSACQARSS